MIIAFLECNELLMMVKHIGEWLDKQGKGEHCGTVHNI